MQTPDETQSPAGRAAEMHPSPAAGGVGPGYEVRDTNIKGVVTFIVGLFAVLIVTEFGLRGLLDAINVPRTTPPPTASAYTEPQQPGAVVAPPRGKVTPESVLEIVEQRRKLRADEDATLGGHGPPADTTKGGAVSISIDRAIELISERGLPKPGGPPRTEVEVNSHSGKAAPAGVAPPKQQVAPAAEVRDLPEKRTKN